MSNLPSWLWAIPGLLAAALVYWGLSKFFGFKVGLMGALAVIGVATLKVITAGAYKRGSAEQREKQQKANAEAIERANQARERERERQAAGGTNENDPFNRDNR